MKKRLHWAFVVYGQTYFWLVLAIWNHCAPRVESIACLRFVYAFSCFSVIASQRLFAVVATLAVACGAARWGAAVVNEFRRASRRKFQVSFVTAVRSDQLTQILRSVHFQSKMKRKRNQLHYILVLFLVAISHANKSNPRYVAPKKPRHMPMCLWPIHSLEVL